MAAVCRHLWIILNNSRKSFRSLLHLLKIHRNAGKFYKCNNITFRLKLTTHCKSRNIPCSRSEIRKASASRFPTPGLKTRPLTPKIV